MFNETLEFCRLFMQAYFSPARPVSLAPNSNEAATELTSVADGSDGVCVGIGGGQLQLGVSAARVGAAHLPGGLRRLVRRGGSEVRRRRARGDGGGDGGGVGRGALETHRRRRTLALYALHFDASF